MSPETELEAALDQTYDALLAGDIVALQNLGVALDRIDDVLIGIRRDAAERLRRKAQRNGRLLLAAERGLRAAQSRLGEIFSAPTLTTYDARGRKESVGKITTLAPKRL